MDPGKPQEVATQEKKKKKKSSDYLIYYFCGINLNHENHYNAMFRFVYFKKGEDRYKVKKKKKKD